MFGRATRRSPNMNDRPDDPLPEINSGRPLTVLQGGRAGTWPKLPPETVTRTATVEFEYDTAERIIRLSSALIDFLEGSNGNLRSLLAVYDPPEAPRCRFGRLGVLCRALFGKPTCRAHSSADASDSSANTSSTR